MKNLFTQVNLSSNQIDNIAKVNKNVYGYFLVGLAGLLTISCIDIKKNYDNGIKPAYIANIIPVPSFITNINSNLFTSIKKQKKIAEDNKNYTLDDIDKIVGNPATIEDGNGATKKQKKLAAKKNNLKEMTSSLAVPKEKMDRAEKYVSLYLKYAKEEEKKFGIPVSITLAQGILESNCGESSLADKHNNHFGVKWRKGNKNPYVIYADDSPKDKFVKYASVKHSFRGHSMVLQNERYKRCYKTKNYKAWAIGLKQAGYATGKNYDKKLISIIQRMKLYKYDFKN